MHQDPIPNPAAAALPPAPRLNPHDSSTVSNTPVYEPRTPKVTNHFAHTQEKTISPTQSINRSIDNEERILIAKHRESVARPRSAACTPREKVKVHTRLRAHAPRGAVLCSKSMTHASAAALVRTVLPEPPAQPAWWLLLLCSARNPSRQGSHVTVTLTPPVKTKAFERHHRLLQVKVSFSQPEN